jgi:hypothetical protein
LWLSTEGGIRADPDNTTAKLNEAFYRQYGTGLERSLRDGIVRYARQAGTPSTPYRLTVGEVLYLALDLTGGDMRKASLTVHNTLRSLARGKSNGDADQPITGVEGDPTFENKYLQALRLPKKAGTTRENGGPWYHLFGTMHLEIEARGDWGAWVSNAAGHFTGSKLLSLVGKIGSVFLGLESGRGVSVLSETGNEMEQAVRLGRVDPEKYCFNLWGATIGAWIYRELPGVAMRRFTEPFSSFERPQLDRPTFGAPPETGRYFSGSGSPFSIQWTGPGYAALFDQGRGEGQINMYGGAPFLIQPYPTADGSWGAIWSSGDGEQPVVTFEANQPNAELHVFHADRTGGTVAFYRARAEREGERLTLMPAPAGGPPELRNESGVVFPPTLHELPGTGGLFGDSRTGIVLIVLGLVVTLAGVVWLRNFPRAA